MLWAFGFISAALVLPYVATLEAKVLAAKAASMHLTLQMVLALSLAQSALILAVAVFAGLWAARKVGLGAPIISAWVTRQPLPASTVPTFVLAIAVGAAMGLAIIALDREIFAPIASVAQFIALTQNTGIHPPPLQGFLASFYGAFGEEILMRLGLLSLLALLFRMLARWFGASRDVALSSGVFWTANIAAALLFGAGHLPAAMAVAPLTVVMAVRIILLNALGGIVFGTLYRRYGLEWAMGSHFAADIVLHVLAG